MARNGARENYGLGPAERQTGSYGLKGSREVTTGGFVLGATGDVGVGNPFLGGGGPRGIQLAAKFTF